MGIGRKAFSPLRFC